MAYLQAKKDFINAVETALGSKIAPASLPIGTPPNMAMGDLSLAAFPLGKALGMPAGEAASSIAAKLKPRGLIHAYEAVGPYINAFLDRSKFAQAVFREMNRKKNKYGMAAGRKKIILEFVSPNTNKPLHLGHLRNAFLGAATSGLLKAAGCSVINSILYNDRGIHIMKSMLAYSRFGKGETPKSAGMKGDHFVGKYYVRFETEAKTNPALEDEAQEWLRSFEKGDKKILVLWTKMNKWAEDGFKETLDRLGISFDVICRESALYKKGKKIVFDGLKKGVFVKDENGNIIAPLGAFNLPNKVVLRADGTAVYATTDIALAQERWKKYHFDKLIYVVGMEQDLHFKQLFKIFELLKFPFSGRCEHLSYNWVYLPEGRMKSREGTVVDGDTLLEELHELSLREIKERDNTLKAKEAEARAEIISQAALKYYLLQVDPKSDIHFNPAEAIAFTGRTGPYIQYSYARISSLLKKAGARRNLEISKFRNIEISDAEHRLIFLLGKFEEIIKESALRKNGALMAKYLYEVSSAFSDFYEKEPVLKAHPQLRVFRLHLSRMAGDVIFCGLNLLGIVAPARM